MSYATWKEYNSSDLFNLYKNICSTLKIKEKWSYTPREFSIMNLYYKPIYKDLFNAKSMDERLTIINSISPSDDISKTLIQYCYKDKSLPKVSRKSIISKYQYILDKVKETGNNIFYYTVKSIKELVFCSKHKIKYLKQVINNFLVSTTYTIPISIDYIIGRKEEIVDRSCIENNMNC